MKFYDHELGKDSFMTPHGKSLDASFRLGTNDRDTLTACIVGDDYHFTSFVEPAYMLPATHQHAIDLGGHIGGCSLILASLGYAVKAVEVLPENQELFMLNVASSGLLGKITLYSHAVSNTDGDVITVQYGDTSTESGRMHQFMGNTRLGQSIDSRQECKVTTISLETLLADIDRCHIVKTDCEGSEWKAFANLSDAALNKIDWISAELHDGSPEELTNMFMDMLRGQFEDVSELHRMPIGHNLFKSKKL